MHAWIRERWRLGTAAGDRTHRSTSTQPKEMPSIRAPAFPTAPQYGPTDGARWVANGLEACDIDTSEPGARYEITYSLASTGLEATVTRTVIVQAACALGEFPCTQLGQCSGEAFVLVLQVGNSRFEAPGRKGSRQQLKRAHVWVLGRGYLCRGDAANTACNCWTLSMCVNSIIICNRSGWRVSHARAGAGSAAWHPLHQLAHQPRPWGHCQGGVTNCYQLHFVWTLG